MHSLHTYTLQAPAKSASGLQYWPKWRLAILTTRGRQQGLPLGAGPSGSQPSTVRRQPMNALKSSGNSTAPGFCRAALATWIMYSLGDMPASLAHSTSV